MKKTWLATAALITGMCGTPAVAQEADEAIVVLGQPTSVGKLDAPLSDQPVTVTVISRDRLDAFGEPRLEDVAYATIGLQPVAPLSGAASNGFFLRGFNGAPVAIDGYYGNANAFGTTSFVDMAIVENVEVLRGPASILYGQSNPGGVVNLATKRPLFDYGAAVAAIVDEHGGRRVEADATGPLGDNVAFRLVGVAEDSETFRDFVNNERLLLAPSLLANLGDDVTVRLNYVYDDFTYTADVGPGVFGELIANLPVERNLGEPLAPDSTALNQTFRAEADWRFADDWTLRAGLFRHWGEETSYDIDLNSVTGTTVARELYVSANPDNNESEDWMATIQLGGRFETGPLRHNVSMAYDYVDQRTSYQADAYIIPSIDYQNPIYQTGSIPTIYDFSYEGSFQTFVKAYYAQDLISVGEHWRFLIGARHDEIETEGFADPQSTISVLTSDESATTPRLGVVYEANEAWTFYGSYSGAFVPLIGLDRFNRPFEPEESRSYEFGLRRVFGDDLVLTAAIYTIEKENILVVDPVDTNFNINAGVAQSNGFELELQGRIAPNWRIGAGLAYTDATITESADPAFPEGDRLPGASEWTALFNTTYTITDGPLTGLGLGANVAYGSERPYVVPNTPDELEAYTRVDLVATYPIGHAELQLNVNNLFDERILLANGYGSAKFDLPRTVSLSLRYRFGALAE